MIRSTFARTVFKKTAAVAGLVVVLSMLALPLKAALAASTDYSPLTTLPIPGFQVGKTVNPVSVIKNIYGVSIGIAALLAVAMITWAGIEYATTEAIEGKSGAKEKWQGAIWGLLLLLGAYVILRTINIDLVNINLANLGKTCYNGTGPTAATNGIPCGEAVQSGAIGSAYQSALVSSTVAMADYKASQQKATDAQKAATDLQTQLTDLTNKCLGMAQGSTEQKDCETQLTALQKQTDDAQKAAVTAQSTAAINKLTAAATMSAAKIQNYVDTKNWDAAKNELSIAETAMNNQVQQLASSNLPVDVLNQAIAIDNANFSLAKQNIIAGQALDSIDSSKSIGVVSQNAMSNMGDSATVSTSYNIAQDSNTQELIISSRQSIVSEYNKANQLVLPNNATEAATFRTQTLARLADFDNNVAKTIGCPNGIVVSQTSVACKQ